MEITYSLEQIKAGYNSLHNELEGAPAYGVPDVNQDIPQ